MNSNPENTLHADVLVVGAGPTGLITAGELARRDVRVRVIEKYPTRQSLSKALVLHARTLEIMDVIGIAGAFTARGYPAPGLNIGLGGPHPLSVEMNDLPTRFPYMLVLPQKDTEEILDAHLQKHQVKPERGHELIGTEQSEHCVTARVRTAEGAVETITSRYLVACDGSHSTVRGSIGLPWVGKDYEDVVFLADVKLDSEFNRSRITNFTSGRGFVSILPFLGEYARVFAVDFTKQQTPESAPLTLPDLQDTVDAVLPFRVALSEPRWITRFRSPSRQVPFSRVGRIFLAGDAAHAHSPAGGQGMNTGLQDGFNLGWKLAMVLRGQAPDSILDSFHAERHPVDTRVQHQTDVMFRSFLLRNRLLKAGRDLALRSLLPLPPVQRKLAGNLSGIGVDYCFTDRSRSDNRHKEASGGLPAGARIRDAELWAPQPPTVRVYDLLRQPGFTLCAFASLHQLRSQRQILQGLMNWIAGNYAGAIRPYLVLDEGVPEEAGINAPVLVDFKSEFRRSLSPEPGAVLLMRPDGYLAFHVRGFQPEHLGRLLSNWVQATSLPSAA